MKPVQYILLGMSLIFCSPLLRAQDGQTRHDAPGADFAADPVTLVSKGEVAFHIPLFSYEGEPVCDSAGNLFFELSDSPIIGVGPFLGIKSDGSSHKVFTIPNEAKGGSTETGSSLQAVTPSGDYYLLWTDSKSIRLIAYKADGSVRDSTSFQMSRSVNLERFAIGDKGISYIQGFWESNDSNDKLRRAFAAIYSSDGKLIRDLSDRVAENSPASRSDHPIEGAATFGENGLIYLLNGSQILVFSQSGELRETLKVPTSAPSYYPLRMDVSGGLISIKMVSASADSGTRGRLATRLIVIDAQTNELRGFYKLDSELSNSVLCFTRRDGYSIYSSKDRQAAAKLVPVR